MCACTPRRRPDQRELGSSTPYGIRTRVTGVKGRGPRPLDERGPTSELAERQHTSSDRGACANLWAAVRWRVGERPRSRLAQDSAPHCRGEQRLPTRHDPFG